MKYQFLTFLFLALNAQISLNQNVAFAIDPLADDYVLVTESPDPDTMYCYTPGICRLDSGRLVVTMDLGGDGVGEYAKREQIETTWNYGRRENFGQVFISDDHGQTWTRTATFPFFHARPFVANDRLYILGRETKQIQIIASDDQGLSWTKPVTITSGDSKWHQSACNVWYQNGAVYLVMEKTVTDRRATGWPVSIHAPVLMKANEEVDLTTADAWTLASDLVFDDEFDADPSDDIGVPFWPTEERKVIYLDPPKGRGNHPSGWLETNVVSFPDSKHLWHDPSGRTFYLFSRAHTSGTGFCCLSKVTEQADGSMLTSIVRAPSGQRMLFLPMPGGHLRFHVLYDKDTQLYWLLSSQATDSMTRPQQLGSDRYGLPNNERHRLQLHFSKNMVDWCFAGLVTKTDHPQQARHYASMCIDDQDLVIVSRSGDHRAKSAHDGNMITFHRIPKFRDLTY